MKILNLFSLMSTHIFHSLWHSTKDIRLLWWSVFIRMLAYGLTNQFFTLYLKELGVVESKIGLFMSLTLVGDSVLSYALTWNSHRIGNKNIMVMGSALMVLSAFVFSTGTTNFIYLLLAAIFGVISPSGSDTGPFKTIEETSLAHLTPPNHRPEIYAIHWIVGSVGSSLGSLMGGVFVNFLMKNGFTLREAYQNGFRLICLLSTFKFVSLLFLSHRVETTYKPKYLQVTVEETDDYGAVSDIIPTADCADASEVEHNTLTGLSNETQLKLINLLIPFMLDSFGYGFMPSAWIIYYFKYYLSATPMLIGTVFAVAELIVAVSSIPSAYISKVVGPIRGTILTQIPCSFIIILIPFLGSDIPLVLTFYLINQWLVAFDVVPRQIILTTIFKTSELPKVLGTVNIGKQIARSIPPYFTGVLAGWGRLGVCFVIKGVCLLLANLILAYQFRDLDSHIKLIESQHHDLH